MFLPIPNCLNYTLTTVLITRLNFPNPVSLVFQLSFASHECDRLPLQLGSLRIERGRWIKGFHWHGYVDRHQLALLHPFHKLGARLRNRDHIGAGRDGQFRNPARMRDKTARPFFTNDDVVRHDLLLTTIVRDCSRRPQLHWSDNQRRPRYNLVA
jgi:hypothetical protein